MNEYEKLDFALDYLNEGKLPFKIKNVGDLLKTIGAVVLTAAVVIFLLPLVAIIVAIMLIVNKVNEKEKKQRLETILKEYPELKDALIKLAKNNQATISKKCKDFKPSNIKIDYNSIKDDEIVIGLGAWEPKIPTRDDILKYYAENFVDMSNYPEYDSAAELAEDWSGYDITETLREFCEKDADAVFKYLEKKYHLTKSYEIYNKTIEELDKTYKASTGTSMLSIKNHRAKDLISKEDEPVEICFLSTDAGYCELTFKYVDANNFKLPEFMKSLVDKEVAKRSK